MRKVGINLRELVNAAGTVVADVEHHSGRQLALYGQVVLHDIGRVVHIAEKAAKPCDALGRDSGLGEGPWAGWDTHRKALGR